MKIGIPRETQLDETRVALTPDALAPLLRDGNSIHIEPDAPGAK
jgi:alanine dehydrogenase